MKNKEYYVYALIDPRDNEYFYIGKGKGNRYNSHLNEKLKDVTNILKYSRIKEIQNENQKVKIEILFPYLTEEAAFKLEMIIIYKIGRKSFREGNLLNFAPGGKWLPGENLFYETKPNIDFNLELLDFVAQEKFLSIEKTSEIIHLDEINPKYSIFKYDLNGTLISIDNIFCFSKNNDTIDLFFDIKKEILPIYYAGYIYSKKPINDFYFSERLISLNKHLVDSKFIKEIEYKISKCKNFTLELKQNGLSRIKVKLDNNLFKVETYYPSNNVHNIQFLKNGLPYGKWFEYFENGCIKDISEYFENGKLFKRESFNEKGIISNKIECFKSGSIKKSWNYYSNGSLHYFNENYSDWKIVLRKCYYTNGKLKYSYNNFKEYIEYSYYNENGKLIEEFVKDQGFVKYNLNKEAISISDSKHMEFIDSFNILKFGKTKEINNKMSEEEERKTNDDWEIYQKLIDKKQFD